MGRRIALEIKEAKNEDKLQMILA
ncbi:hypothetical protein MUO66_07120 [Candidatus Bathyarchaeota archaeon]|nr:hypothetical protein [Candidatus Bathyarchaeota archaeon]